MEITKRVCDICGCETLDLTQMTFWSVSINEICSTCVQIVKETLIERTKQGDLPRDKRNETLEVLV